VRAQGLQSLIEVRIASFSAHGCLPVCEDIEKPSSLATSNLAQKRYRPQFSMETNTQQSQPGTSLAEVHGPGCCYVITSVAHGKAAATNSLPLTGESEEEKRFERQAIKLGDFCG
jgi:hypothetical protein